MNNIYEILKKLDIAYKKYEHPAVFTCEDAEIHYKDIKGGHSKNLFLRDKKGHKHFLVTFESHKNLDIKSFEQKINEHKLGFASPERLKKYLELTPGSVSPFGLINDEKQEVEVFIDTDLITHEKVHFHPNINTATLELTSSDFKKFLDATKNQITYIKI